MENDDYITIGIRGEAKQAHASAIILIIFCSVLVFVMALSIVPVMNHSSEIDGYIPLIIIISVFMVLGILGILYFVASLKWANNNDNYINKPVLKYDPNNDTFIGYDTRHDNKEIIIKNGNIKSIRGSAIWTARELFVTYINDDKETKKVSLGFCRNIDNNAFRKELNKYHHPKL